MIIKKLLKSLHLVIFITYTTTNALSMDLNGSWTLEYDNSLNSNLDEKFLVQKIDLKKEKNEYLFINKESRYTLRLLPKRKYHNIFLLINNEGSNYSLISTMVLINDKYAKGTWHDNDGKSGDIIISKIQKADELSFKNRYKGFGLQGKYGFYQWATAYEVPSKTGAYVTFLVNAKNDIYLCFSKEKKQNSKMYEIALGSWNNNRSAIRYKSQGMELIATDINKTPKSLIQRDKWQWYWAGVINGKISVGKGKIINENIIMETTHSNQDLNNNINWICFSSWDAPVAYKEITIMR